MTDESINVDDYWFFPQRDGSKIACPKTNKITLIDQYSAEEYKIWFSGVRDVMAYCSFNNLLKIFCVSPPPDFFEGQKLLDRAKRNNEVTFLNTKLIKTDQVD